MTRLILAGTLALPLALLMRFGRPYYRARRARRILSLLSRLILAALGVRVQVSGQLRQGAKLIVANHISWLDLLVISALMPMRPVAKAEVATWPIIGSLAKQSGAIFIGRQSLRQVPEMVTQIAAALRSGESVQVFPEATTRCGTGISHFHRAAFQAAIDTATPVQAIALSYQHITGEPANGAAFVGDQDLMTSLRGVLRIRQLSVGVKVLQQIPGAALAGIAAVDRRRVAGLAERDIARTLAVPVVSSRHLAPVATDKDWYRGVQGAAGAHRPQANQPQRVA